MIYYAVFDTNVLVSSLLTKYREAATARVVDAITSGSIIPLYNDEIIEEYTDVLHRDKFPFKESDVRALIDSIKEMGISVNPTPTGETLPDMDDLVFYEVVMEKREDDAYLITGNMKHFPERNYIVTPAEMMAIIEAYFPFINSTACSMAEVLPAEVKPCPSPSMTTSDASG